VAYLAVREGWALGHAPPLKPTKYQIGYNPIYLIDINCIQITHKRVPFCKRIREKFAQYATLTVFGLSVRMMTFP